MAQQVNNNIPVIERYWTLVDKADKKFSKIRDLPYYERNRYDTYFYKVFKVYTLLWKFQQENRQKLVEAGLKRWEIGEIASRIAQLYYGQYMRTSEASYLSEAYVFYEAILLREYFKEGLCQELNLSNKQLRFLARFLMVCLVSNRREMVTHLVNQIRTLVDECKRTFQETDFKEWKLVIQEINRFLKADGPFMNIRPLRYSLLLDPHPDALPNVTVPAGRRNLRLRDSILTSYNHNEVKFSELSVDSFRMLQCLEWEPSGSFYQSGIAKSSQNGEPGPCRINCSQDIVDPTLPPNPRKAVLYRPSVTQFIAVLATICEELPLDGVLLVYLSASGCANNLENAVRSLDTANHSQNLETTGGMNLTGCLQFGHRENGGLNCIYPSDLIPFTRKPLFIIIDSDSSEAFKYVSGSEKGEPAALLLSPSSTLAFPDSSRHPIGSLFTIFLTAPLQAFCLLIGVSGSDIEMDTYDRAEKLLSSSFNEWGLTLAASETLNPVWAQILRDPFLRRFLLRFIFCCAALTLCVQTSGKKEFHPNCLPPLPDSLVPTAATCQSVILQLANVFGASNAFIFSEGGLVSDTGNGDAETISAS